VVISFGQHFLVDQISVFKSGWKGIFESTQVKEFIFNAMPPSSIYNKVMIAILLRGQ